MNTFLLEEDALAEELAGLNAQIEHARQLYAVLEEELRDVEAELETFSGERARFDALRNVCASLDKLGELNAQELFWDGIAEPRDVPGHRERIGRRIAGFERTISAVLDKQASLREEINHCGNELNIFYEELREIQAREERRQDEYVVEREISSVPRYPSLEIESDRRFRRALQYAFLFCICFSAVILLWKLPPPVKPVVAEVPQRLVSMLRKEPPKPEPLPERKEEKKPENNQEKEAKQDKPKPTAAETQAARKKAESTGVLAFKDTFKDLMNETPASRLGAEARLTNQSSAAGQARSSRSLIAMQSTAGTSGGISNAGVSRNVGNGNNSRLGGVGFTRVQSAVAGLTEKSRPLSSGPGPARTDEEIQIVFDRYKATLYRMYNAELRKNPTLRGKIVLRITIEPGGEVSACNVQSNDLASAELVAQIVERVKKFNFGPKEKVSKVTILYPIDFLPAT